MAIEIKHSEAVRGALHLRGESLPINEALYLRGWDTAEVIINGEVIKDANGDAKTFPRVIFDYAPLSDAEKGAASLQINGDTSAAQVFLTTLTRRVVGYESDNRPVIIDHVGRFVDVVNSQPSVTEDFAKGMDALCKALLAEEAGTPWKIIAIPVLKKDRNGKLYPSQYYNMVH